MICYSNTIPEVLKARLKKSLNNNNQASEVYFWKEAYISCFAKLNSSKCVNLG